MNLAKPTLLNRLILASLSPIMMPWMLLGREPAVSIDSFVQQPDGLVTAKHEIRPLQDNEIVYGLGDPVVYVRSTTEVGYASPEMNAVLAMAMYVAPATTATPVLVVQTTTSSAPVAPTAPPAQTQNPVSDVPRTRRVYDGFMKKESRSPVNPGRSAASSSYTHRARDGLLRPAPKPVN
ncbi:MAG: hypothetical protein H6502_05315 [Candidatus Woesearchaeota archaeon]|nr:MAG: hypothetical protein H6502_05315 [Candidatus Woesearchaeota archaeon]